MEITECIGALDQGTQSTRFFLFDRDCRPLACHQVDLPQIYPQAGWVEHDPLEIWRTVQECMARAWEDAQQAAVSEGRPPLRLLSIGLTNQRETTVVWSRSSGRPLHNAIVWLDNRTSELCESLAAQLGGRDALRAATGLPISPYFSATKYLWMYDNVPEVRAAVDAGDAAVGTVDSWLIWQLTGGPAGGVHVTDVSNASRTLLMDLGTLAWHPPALAAFRCPEAALPRIASNAEVYGRVSLRAPDASSFGGGHPHPHHGGHPLRAFEGVPIAGCLGDQQAAMLGQRCRPGEAKATYGTGCFTLLNTGQRRIASSHGLLTTVAFQLGPDKDAHYALEGSVAVAGLGISWLRDNLGLIGSAAESATLAASVPDTGGVYLVPAFSGLLAPRWRPDARGTVVGMTSFTTRAHIVRAMLEAICFQTREVLDAMRADAELESHGGLAALRCDGGAAANDTLMQLQADLLQVPVLRPAFRETTSLGAALAAGLAVGFWSREELFAQPAPANPHPANPHPANPHPANPHPANPHPANPRKHSRTPTPEPGHGADPGYVHVHAHAHAPVHGQVANDPADGAMDCAVDGDAADLQPGRAAAAGEAGAEGCANGCAAPAADAVRAFAPCIPHDQAERRYGHWRKAVQRSLDLADLAEV